MIRNRWYVGGMATLICATLVFGGVGLPAVAAETPTATPSDAAGPAPEPDQSATEEPASPADETAPVADEVTPPADEVTPVEEEATPPAEEVTPPAGEPAAPTEETAPDVDPEPSPDPSASPSPDATEPSAEPVEAVPDAGVLVVPAPSANTAVITVKVGSDRTPSDVTGVTSLAGVTLLLNTGTASAPSGTRPDGVAGTADGWAKCVSDSDGDCSFTVPDTQAPAPGGVPAGVNRDARYWVVQAGVPDGYYANPVLRTGDPYEEGDPTPYRFRTGAQLRAGNTYSSQNANDFMLSSGRVPTASGGIWQQSRVNPAIAQSCGLDVALILDLSGSVEPSLPQLKEAADAFVNALQGTPSRMSLFSFSTVTPATRASVNYPALTPVSTAAQADAFKSRYADWGADGYTNWDRGLAAADEANTPDNNFEVAVIVTDGNPTAYNQPPENLHDNRFREVENGVFSANGLKRGPDENPAPTRVLALGVGAGATGEATALNLRAISGPTAYNGSNGAVADYYQTEDYPAAGQALRDLALGNCEGNLTVTKQIVPSTAPAGTTEGAVPAGAGWQFTSTSNTTGVTIPTPVLTTTADGTGTVNFEPQFAAGVTSGSITVVEAQQPGFTLQPVDGQNAVCLNESTEPGTPVPVTNTALGFTVDVPSAVLVSCTIYNRAPAPEANLTVTKNWVINGVAYANGAQPTDFSAQLQLTGPGAAGATNQDWGVTRTGYAVGDTAALSETVTLVDPTMCINAAVISAVNGTATDIPLTPGTGVPVTLSQVSNTATITNTVTCDSELTLIKEVQGGDATADSWSLEAQFLAMPSVATGLPGFSGASGSPAATSQIVTPNARYQLIESGGDPRYRQTDNRTDLQVNPQSTGSATCIRVNADGTPYAGSGYSDGINGGVNVPLGYRVACTLLNQTASITLLKHVVNDNGGTATADDWELTGTPSTLTGLSASTVVGSEMVVGTSSTFQVRPAHVYTLSEHDVAGYQFSRLQEFVAGNWVDVVASADPAGYPRQDANGDWMVTVEGLDNHVYRFVNDDVAGGSAELQIVKTASVATVSPGRAFSYTLAVENVSDTAADGVVVTDAIPADLRITNVSWPGEGDPTVDPNWTACEVTGQSASGYGGMLRCELSGVLQPAGSDAGPASAPTITLAATVNPASKATQIRNVGVVDYYTFGNPDDRGHDEDDATVTLASLPPTGGGSALPFAIFGILAIAGGTALLLARRLRGAAGRIDEARPTV